MSFKNKLFNFSKIINKKINYEKSKQNIIKFQLNIKT